MGAIISGIYLFSNCEESHVQKITIQDIADTLGISGNTVSKAINNMDGTAESKKEKIVQKTIEMGYRSFSYASI